MVGLMVACLETCLGNVMASVKAERKGFW
jgi:hypothetical protein